MNSRLFLSCSFILSVVVKACLCLSDPTSSFLLLFLSTIIFLSGTKLNYRPGKKARLEEPKLSTDVSSMEFDPVVDEDEETESKDNDEENGMKKGKDDAAKDDLQFAESFNPFMRFSQGDIDNMDKEVADVVSRLRSHLPL